MYTLRKTCRACGFGPMVTASGIKIAPGTEALLPVFDLGLQPLANDFALEDGECSGFAPLKVMLCPRCALSQLSIVVRPEILYSRYLYVTSKSTMMQEHFGRLWADCRKLADSSTVIEIGSNDGDFLKFCLGHGASAVCGIEPADNLAEKARKNGVNTINDFFSPESASMAKDAIPEPGLIFARHVFCHVNDWAAFMSNVQFLADSKTVICIEVPYVLDQLERNSFDQIYHEHLSYLSISSIQALLNSGPFQLQTVLHYPIHGGAIVLVIRRRSPGRQPDRVVTEYLSREINLEQQWSDFSVRCWHLINSLRDTIRRLSERGKRIVGFGASAKSTVWINAMGLKRSELQCVYDCTPEKLYRFVPGTNIPVIHEGAFFADASDYAVLFAWNYAGEVIAKHDSWLKGGGKFIIPVPKVRFIGLDGRETEE